MKPDDFEKRLRTLEYFHALRLIPGAWAVVRVDGRGFSRFIFVGGKKMQPAAP